MKKIKKFRLFFIALLLFVGIFCVYVILNVPDLDIEKITDISQTLTVYDREGNVSAVLNSGENRENIKFENIPKYVIDALIATEDVRFYKHNGIDIKRIFGATFNNIKSGGLKEGASTITQQLIKNSHLTNEKTFSRKINEAILALQLERRYNKNEIVEMYLNLVYFGRGAYGLQAASQAYFGVDVTQLTCAQGAMLIGILKAPGKYAPHLNMENAIRRRNTVLSQMKKYGYISEEEYKLYSTEKVTIAEEKEIGDYGYFTDFVLEEGADLLGISVNDFMGSGYRVYTTLDSYMQKELQTIYLDKNNFPDNDVQSAAVLIDNETGGISAMIGGREHQGMRLYNRATALRQPGSCIKPILVYAPALENGSITAATVLDDYRKDFNGYSPTNFKEIYYGKVTIREALRRSLNVPAVEILNMNGIDYSKSFAEKAGIAFNNDDNYLALALGGMRYGTSQLQLAGAYRCFASEGNYIKPWCIDKITDADGNVLYEHKDEGIQVYKSSTAWIITDILCDVARQNNNPLSKLGYKIACKTGTVGYNGKGYSDALSSVYSETHTLSVWMGYDKTNDESYLDESVTGSTYPTEIALQVFRKLIEKYGYTPFTMPDTVSLEAIDINAVIKGEEKVLANEFTPQKDISYEYFEISSKPNKISVEYYTPKNVNDFSLCFNEVRDVEMSFTVIDKNVEYVVYKNGSELKRFSGVDNERIKYIDKEYISGDKYSIKAVNKYFSADNKRLESDISKDFYVN